MKFRVITLFDIVDTIESMGIDDVIIDQLFRYEGSFGTPPPKEI